MDIKQNGALRALSVALFVGMFAFAIIEAQGCQKSAQPDEPSATEPSTTPEVMPATKSGIVAPITLDDAPDAGAKDAGGEDAGVDTSAIDIAPERPVIPATKSGPVFPATKSGPIMPRKNDDD